MSFAIQGDQVLPFHEFLDQLQELEKSKKNNLTDIAQDTLKRTLEVSIDTNLRSYSLSVLAKRSFLFKRLLTSSEIKSIDVSNDFFKLNNEKTFFVLNLCEKGFIPLIKNIDEAITIFKIANHFGISYIKQLTQEYLIQNLNSQNCSYILDGLFLEMDQKLQTFIKENLDLVVKILTDKSSPSLDYNNFEVAINRQKLLKLFNLEQSSEWIRFLCERIEPENFAETVVELFPQEEKLEFEIKERLCQKIINLPHFTTFLQQQTKDQSVSLREMMMFLEVHGKDLKTLTYQADSTSDYYFMVEKICEFCPHLENLNVVINGTVPVQDMNKDIEIVKVCQKLKKQLLRLSIKGFPQRNDFELQNLFSHLIFRRKDPTHFILTSSFYD